MFSIAPSLTTTSPALLQFKSKGWDALGTRDGPSSRKILCISSTRTAHCFTVYKNKGLQMSVDCRLDKSITNGLATKEEAADDLQELLFREKAKAQSGEESVFVQKRGQADVSGIHTRVHTIPLCGEQETQRSNCFWGDSRRSRTLLFPVRLFTVADHCMYNTRF